MLNKKTHKDVVWYDFIKPQEEEFLPLAEKYSINKYIIKKFLNFTNRDKVINLGNHIFVSLTFPDLQNKEFEDQTIKFILGEKKIFVAQTTKNEGLIKFAKIFEEKANFEKDDNNDSCVAFVFLHMIEKIYENTIFELDKVREEIDEIEADIFDGKARKMVERISLTNRKLIDFHKNLKSHQESWEVFFDIADDYFQEDEAKDGLETIILSYSKTIDHIEQLKELLKELRDTNNSLLYANQGQVMKNFTTISFLTLPITLFLNLVSVPSSQHFMGIVLEHDVILLISIILFVIFLGLSKMMKWW